MDDWDDPPVRGWREFAAWRLAGIFIASDWTPQGMAAAVREALGPERPRKWLPLLIAEVIEESPTPYAPSPNDSEATDSGIAVLSPVLSGSKENPALETFHEPMPVFAPIPAFREMGLPQLANSAELAHWLNLSPRYLDWFADVEGYRGAAETESTRHYTYRWVPKRTGPPRLIEAPKQLLKGLQRKILREILDPVAPHDCAHGFRRGRSCLTGGAAPCGRGYRRHHGPEGFLSLGRDPRRPWPVPQPRLSLGGDETPDRAVQHRDAGGPVRRLPAGQAARSRNPATASCKGICRRARRPRRPWPISAPGGWIAGWTGWRGGWARATPATATISPFRATGISRRGAAGSCAWRRRSARTRASR